MIVKSYHLSMLIVESISASRSEGTSISASRSEGASSRLIVNFILPSRNEGEHRIHSANDIKRKPHRKLPDKLFSSMSFSNSDILQLIVECIARPDRKLPDKLSHGLCTSYNSIMSASEGGNFDMARSISQAHNISATSSANTSSEGDFRNLKALLETRSHSAFIFGRLTSSLVRGTAIKMAGQAQLSAELAITSVVCQYNVNDTGCQQSWQRISQLFATTEATAASVATQPFLSKPFVATLPTAFATAFATASAALVSVSIMQLAILSRLRQQRRSLSLWPHHNGFYVKPLTSAAYSDLLASILASKISVTYLLWQLSIERVTYLLCNLHQYLRKG